MALVATEAIVLRSYNLAEADRIVVCLTRNAGLVRAVARGARRMKSRFGAALEPFSLINLVFYERENRELVTISQAEILKSHFMLASQPEAANALAYMAELVGEFAPPHEVNDKLYRMVKACLDAFEDAPEEATYLMRYFEVWLLRLAGLFPELEVCVQCARLFNLDESCELDVESRARCHHCGHGYGILLSAEARQALLATRRLTPGEFLKLSRELSKEAQNQIGELTHSLLVRTLEKRPRTIMATG